MTTLKTEFEDFPYDRHKICLAFKAIETDWNVDGWVRERPSSLRRMESIGTQLHRIHFRESPLDDASFVGLLPDGTYDGFHDDHEIAREVYLRNLVKFGLAAEVVPDDELGAYIYAVFAPEFIAKHFPKLVN